MPDLSLRKLTELSPLATALAAALGTRSIALVGMMGAGKSLIGRRLAKKLDVPSESCPLYPAAPMPQEVCNERGGRPVGGRRAMCWRRTIGDFRLENQNVIQRSAEGDPARRHGPSAFSQTFHDWPSI
jgi:hypothetical protein